MYSLVRAIAKPLTSGARWREVDISAISLNDLFASYGKILATLNNVFLTEPVCLDLAAIRSEYGSSTMTLDQVLVQIGTRTLPTTATLPVLRARHAKYKDAFRAGYKVAPVHPTIPEGTDMPPADRKWLKLTKPNVDYAKFHDSCLVSINGYFHMTDTDGQAIYVVNGMTSQTICRQNQIGIYNFQEIGKITRVPITAGMVYKQKVGERVRDRAFVDLGINLDNKTVMLVLGGYLQTPDPRAFYRVGDKQVCVNMQVLPLLDRHFEMSKFLDMSELDLETTSRNDTQLSVEEFYSDETLTKLLTMSQSFFVVIEHPDVFVERKTVHKTKMPGMYISFEKPQYPLVNGVGRLSDYWYTGEDGQWSMTCYDGKRDNALYNTVNYLDENSVGDSREPSAPTTNSYGQFLKIGIDL